ncbi:uncharacterized protein LOC123015969 [Tribolium madens]|uniref:uncharacterized protein LOC123015969 n=1 Tax=Tribolium madens TaxID=41895 RepID=UPI001CF73C38|nr:uncharacterized protein LOC123015969 [Tribolium madens]
MSVKNILIGAKKNILLNEIDAIHAPVSTKKNGYDINDITTKTANNSSVEVVRRLKRRLEERQEILSNKRILAESILDQLSQQEEIKKHFKQVRRRAISSLLQCQIEEANKCISILFIIICKS